MKKESKYSKEGLIRSNSSKNIKSLINALVKDGEELTIHELNQRINTFNKKEIKER